jgi:hypothetical protein
MLGACLREIAVGDVAGLAPHLFVFGTDHRKIQKKFQWLFRAHGHDGQRPFFSGESDFREGTVRIAFNILDKRVIFRGYTNRSPKINFGAAVQFKRMGLSKLDCRGLGPLWAVENSVSAPPSTETQTSAYG